MEWLKKIEINYQIKHLRFKLQLMVNQAEDLTAESLLIVSRELDDAISAYQRNNATIQIHAAYQEK